MKTKIKLAQSAIYSAIIKYGHSNFSLSILEYCDISELISRENYYINLIKPEYNILQVAGSSLGRILSQESKDKIRVSLLNKFSGEKNPMFGLIGEDHPRFGKTHSTETRLSLRKSKGTPVEVLDMQTNLKLSYYSFNEAAEAIKCSPASITKGLKKSNPFILRKRYEITKITTKGSSSHTSTE